MKENLIFDIGFHKGEDTAHYLKKGYRVIAIEANPVLAEEGKKRFADAVASGQLQLLNIGIEQRDATLDFYVNNSNSEWSSFVPEIGMRGDAGYKVVPIPCKPVSWLFEQYGVPYYMKVDIEGCDTYCLQSIDSADKPKYVSCEVHDLGLLDILVQKGYHKFKCIDQSDKFEPINSRQWENNVYRTFRRVIGIITGRRGSAFKTGSSGPFGEATKGAWQPEATVRKEYKYFHESNPTGEPLNPRSWFDFHATY